VHFSIRNGKISYSGMSESDGRVYYVEPYDDPRNPRGPYLIYEDRRIRTDIFGQFPLFLGAHRIESGIFEKGIQHDPTLEILISENDIGMDFMEREKLPHIAVKEPVEELTSSFREAVELRATEKMGLLLSGGVDSSAIASILAPYGAKAICVGGGKDEEMAVRLAKGLGMDLITVHIDEDEAEAAIPEIYEAIGMKCYVWSTPVYLPVITSLSIMFHFAFREAKKERIEHLFAGTGSEELFAGFTDWTGEDLERQVMEKAYTINRRDLWRDHALAAQFGVEMRYPFLDREFASIALSIPIDLKLGDGIKKYIWRKAAEALGVPHENAWRKNRAAQYGSGADRILERLVKRAGQRYRMNYLMELLEKA